MPFTKHLEGAAPSAPGAVGAPCSERGADRVAALHEMAYAVPAAGSTTRATIDSRIS